MDVTLRILRYNPELDHEPHWEEYVVDGRADATGCSTSSTR